MSARHASQPVQSQFTLGVLRYPSTGAVLTIAGRLDAVEVGRVLDEVQALLKQGVICMVFDLSAVQFIDSAGLAALVLARRECQIRNGQVAIVRPVSADAVRIFRLTQLDEVFATVDLRTGFGRA